MALSQVKPRQFDGIFGRIEYKQMIRSVKDGLGSLSDKYLVDTVFALGKLHKEQSKEPETLNRFGDNKFFQHFFRETLEELTNRLPFLSAI